MPKQPILKSIILPSKPSVLVQFLKKNPKIVHAIVWQNKPASTTDAYAPPTPSCKVGLSKWTPTQIASLEKAFNDYCIWLKSGAIQVPMSPSGLTDQPVNVDPNVSDDAVTAMQSVSPAYMWKLYIAHVAFSLATEYTHLFPWSIVAYTYEQLRYLFDSTTMAWNIFGKYYSMGTYDPFIPALRADNLPKTAFAPPKWTFPFLRRSRLVGNTRIDTIYRVLNWMRKNMAHFQEGPDGLGGDDSFGSYFATWQYRGYPPLSRIVAGTVDTNNPDMGIQHWTAGCHGSVGFLNAVLRAVNIPVQPVWVCGHELVCFLTEKTYMDHGDDPYNLNVKKSSKPISNVLIDEATYRSRFSSDLKVNITDPESPAIANVGRSAAEFPP